MTYKDPEVRKFKAREYAKRYRDKHYVEVREKENRRRRERWGTNIDYKKRRQEQQKLSYQRTKEKVCKRMIKYHWKNRDKLNEQSRIRGKKWGYKLKNICITHYSNGTMKCALCGYSNIDALLIDHIYGGGNRIHKEFKKGCGTKLYKHLIESNFPSGYRILCCNCNILEAKRLKVYGKKASDETIAKYGFNNKKEKE